MKKISALLLALSLLSGCVLFHGYAPPVQQGNVISSKHLDQVKVGMSINQVEAIMGSPVLVNTFRDNRLNYVYTYQVYGHRLQEDKAIISFSRGRVTAIEKDLNPDMHPKKL